MMMFWSKTFRIKDNLVVAICDKELLGKSIKMNKFKVKVHQTFYGGKEIDEEKALKLMEKASIGNLLGKMII